MAILKCKMCGGDIELSADKTCGMCSYCGSTMTFPKVDDEQRAAMFNRGNHFRRIGEFDKALAVYERIVQEDEADAEAHWCCALCRFGIEYVEDPNTFEYLPTCHRASFDSFLEDVDYLAALEHSDGITKRQYQKDAAKIAEVQRGILATSQNEEPFDVFICYKESEEDGSRTRDSLYAQDIYYQLTEQGRRVFFSRITLEDKAGTEYEPYIFADLNSAKVMILVTTSAEHANSVWMKNEWSRFLSLMRKDRSKLLLPCYRDMDPYDLPEALSVLQSYDMGKIGFIQDLIRGVNKVLNDTKSKQAVKETVIVQQINAAIEAQTNDIIAPLLKRAYIFLEDEEWGRANDYAEKVLDIDPENGEAYLLKAMISLTITTRYDLNRAPGIERDVNIQKAMRYGSDSLKNEIKGYIASTKAVEEERGKEKEAAEKALRRAKKKLADRKAAEEKRRKADEKHKAEEAEEEANKVIAAITARQNSKQKQSLEQRLATAKQKVTYLEKLCDNYDQTTSQVTQLNSEKTEASDKLNELRTERNSLGLFAGKEKKRLDTEIIDMVETIRQIEHKLTATCKQLGGFSTKAAADNALALAKSNVSALQTKFDEAKKQGLGEYSYNQAIRTLISNPRVLQIVHEKIPKLISSYQGFVTIRFGRYLQTPKNEFTDIEWLVLKTEEDRALLISKYALDCQPYNDSRTSVTWETCSLRKWLNGAFFSDAFNTDEQKSIQRTTVAAEKNPSYNTSPGKNTKDKVFLLSIAEVNRFFDSDSAKQCEGTAYCYAQGADKDDNGVYEWWLRSPGSDSHSAIIVDEGGLVDDIGADVNIKDTAVRPALWIDLGTI